MKLKNILLEGYAWERKSDGSLPTLQDAIAVHEANKGAAAKDINEYGEDEFDRSSQMYSGGKSRREGKEILDLVSRAEDMLQNIRSNMATNSVLQREEKMGYLHAFNELLDILGDIGYQAELDAE